MSTAADPASEIPDAEATWQQWREEQQIASSQEDCFKGVDGSASQEHWLAAEREEDPRLLAYEASHYAGGGREASIYAAFVAGEVQRLETRLEEWLHELDTCLAGYTRTWTQTLAAPRHVVNQRQDPRQHQHLQHLQQQQQQQQQQAQQQTQQQEAEQQAQAQVQQQQQQPQQRITFESEFKSEDVSDAGKKRPGKPPPGSQRSSGDSAKSSAAIARQSTKKEDYAKEFSAIHDVMSLHRDHSKSIIGKFVMHPYFDNFIVSVVAMNSLLIGAQVQHAAMSDEPSDLLQGIEYFCSIIFSIELILHIIVLGLKHLCHKKRRMPFLFDIFLVLLSWVDMFMSAFAAGDSMSVAKMLRIVRMTKVLRLLRVVSKLGELRIMAMMIVHSLQSLFWLFWLLILLLYIAATILTQGATEYLKYGDGAAVEEGDDVREAYGSLFRTMYTLFKAMSGGVSWGEVAAPMMRVHWLFFLIFLLYIFFTLFSVLNIVTGVFVDSAIQAAQRDRGVLMDKQKKMALATKQDLLALLEEIDIDRTGYISTEEMQESLEQDHIKDYFGALQIETDNVQQLVSLLDENGDGMIDIMEFVDGLQRLKGEAKSFDIHMLMMQNRQVLKTMLEYLEAQGFAGADASSLALGLQGSQALGPQGSQGTQNSG